MGLTFLRMNREQTKSIFDKQTVLTSVSEMDKSKVAEFLKLILIQDKAFARVQQ